MVYAKSNELCHHGIKGQKWGVRRYQNPDGSLTSAGKRRRIKEIHKEYKQLTNTIQDHIYSDSKKVESYYKTGYETSDDVRLKIHKDAAKEAMYKIQNEYGTELASDVANYETVQIGKQALALTGILGVSLAALVALNSYGY